MTRVIFSDNWKKLNFGSFMLEKTLDNYFPSVCMNKSSKIQLKKKLNELGTP